MERYCICWPVTGCNPYCSIHGYLELLTWADTKTNGEIPQWIEDRMPRTSGERKGT